MRKRLLSLAGNFAGFLFTLFKPRNPMKQKLETMFAIQDDLNKVLDPNWRDRNFRFEDAMSVEAVELFDHLPWKWWKKSSGAINFEQVKLEAIDIWHFILSRLLNSFEAEEAADVLFDNYFSDYAPAESVDLEHLKDATRSFLSDVAYENGAEMSDREPIYLWSFLGVLENLGMSFDELYTLFVAKTQLNRLRWTNDYGKTYIKTWDGEEDNVWLSSYVKTLDVNAPDFKDQVFNGLVKKYKEVCAEVLTAEVA